LPVRRTISAARINIAHALKPRQITARVGARQVVALAFTRSSFFRTTASLTVSSVWRF
jgi:hypothetical protein